MPKDFDPYHHWLAIPPDEQPANHYRLLGLREFESDGDVIQNAADRQMAHLRTFQTGKHVALSQKLLNEVSAARICLLNEKRKEEYDSELREQRKPAAPPRAPGRPKARKPAKPAAADPSAPSIVVDTTASGGTRRHGSTATSRSSIRPGWQIALAIGGAIALLILLVGLLVPSGGDGPSELRLQRVSNKSVVTGEKLTLKIVPRQPEAWKGRLHFELGPNPPPGAEIDATSGVLSFASRQAGAVAITVRATNKDDATKRHEVSFRVSVTSPPEPSPEPATPPAVPNAPAPLVIAAIENQTVEPGDELELNVRIEGADPAAGGLQFDIADGPDGLKVDRQTGAVSWTVPGEQRPGEYAVALRVTDAGTDRRAEMRFSVAVRETKPPARELIDLLDTIDLAKHTVRGVWQRGANGISNTGSATLLVPYAPPEEYDVAAVVQRASGDDFIMLGLLGGGKQFGVILDGWPQLGCASGISVIDGRRALDNETATRGRLLPHGREVAIVCKVRRGRLVVQVDGRTIVDWTADYKRCSAEDAKLLPATSEPCMFLNIFNAGFAIKQVHLTPVSGDGRSVQLEQTEPPDQIRKIAGLDEAVTCIRFAIAGERLYTGDASGTVRLYDTDSGRLVRTLSPSSSASPKVVGFSNDGKVMIHYEDEDTKRDSIEIREIRSGETVCKSSGKQWMRMALAGNGRHFCIVDIYGMAIFESTGPKILHKWKHPPGTWADCVTFSPDDRQIMVGYNSSTASAKLRILNVRTGKLDVNLHVPRKWGSWGGSGAICRFGNRAAHVSRAGLLVFDTKSGRLLKTLKTVPDSPLLLALSPGAKHILSGDKSGAIALWDSESGKKLHLFSGHVGKATALAISADGTRFASGGRDKTIRIWAVPQ